MRHPPKVRSPGRLSRAPRGGGGGAIESGLLYKRARASPAGVSDQRTDLYTLHLDRIPAPVEGARRQKPTRRRDIVFARTARMEEASANRPITRAAPRRPGRLLRHPGGMGDPVIEGRAFEDRRGGMRDCATPRLSERSGRDSEGEGCGGRAGLVEISEFEVCGAVLQWIFGRF